MVRRRVERASLWKVMMMLVEGRSGSNVTEAHLKDSTYERANPPTWKYLDLKGVGQLRTICEVC